MGVRVLLALAASTAVTATVAGPMAVQASRSGDGPVAPSTTVSIPAPRPTPAPTPSVLDATDENPPEAMPAPEPTAPSTTATRPTSTLRGSAPPRRPGPATPTTTTTTPATPQPTADGPARPTLADPPPPPTTVPSTTVPLPSTGLAWSPTSARNALQPLAGAAVSGPVWIYLEDQTAQLVRFWLDDPDRTGPPVSVERQFPFSLVPGVTNGQPNPLDTTTLADGPHSVLAEVTTPTGAVELRLALFIVDNP